MANYRVKMKKMAKIGQKWPKFSKFNNFSKNFLTDKFDPGNERFKEPLSYKSKT